MSLTYDGYGRRSQMTDGAGTRTYAYDDGDAPLSVSTAYTGLPSKAITYSYWPDGSRQSMGTPAGAFGLEAGRGGQRLPHAALFFPPDIIDGLQADLP